MTEDGHDIPCRFDEGNRYVVVSRADYDPQDVYVEFHGDGDEPFEFDILSFEIVRLTRNVVLVRPELDCSDEGSVSSDDSYEDYSDDEDDSDESEFTLGSPSTQDGSDVDSDDSYWDDYQ